MKNSFLDFKLANVLIVGDIMLDRYWHGKTERISPEAPVPVVNVLHSEDRPGGAANVALNVARLGGNSQLIGFVGKDEAAEKLNSILNKENVICDFVTVESCPTITKLRILSRHQQLIRADFETHFSYLTSEKIMKKIQKSNKKHNVMILSDYGKGTLQNVQEMIAFGNENKMAIFIDPKGKDFSRYKNATMLTPNLSEFEAIVGKSDSEEDLIKKGEQLIDELNLKALLITRSEQGMTLLQKNKPSLHLKAQAKDIFDVTGAGDTVISVISAAYSTGKTLEESCYLANIAAGIVVGKLGTSSVSIDELFEEISMSSTNRENINSELLSLNELKELVNSARKNGEKIVMTNGCFDLLHSGHVSYLQEARNLGDRLIVALNSDDSVKRLKGETRPINTLNRRAKILSSLKFVDWVIAFDEDTPLNLIKEISPDILVKGGDYKINEIVGADFVLAKGGKVKNLNFEEGISTTKIIEKILSEIH